jgi:hypothetical protein
MANLAEVEFESEGAGAGVQVSGASVQVSGASVQVFWGECSGFLGRVFSVQFSVFS